MVTTKTDDNSYTITGYNDGYYKNDEKVTTNIT